MTVLSAVKSAVLRCDGAQIAEVFSSTEQIAVEMADLVNDVAQGIADWHDWRDLTRIHTFSGGLGSYPKPADYSRMMAGSEIDRDQSLLWGYEQFPSVNDWLRAQSGQWPGRCGGWIIIGGEFQFYPTPSGAATFPYISTLIVRDVNGALKATFDRDDDAFVLDERMLTNGLVWRWKAQKGLEYAEDMTSFEMLRSQIQGRDRGAYVLRAGGRRHNVGFPIGAGGSGGGSGADTNYVAIFDEARNG